MLQQKKKKEKKNKQQQRNETGEAGGKIREKRKKKKEIEEKPQELREKEKEEEEEEGEQPQAPGVCAGCQAPSLRLGANPGPLLGQSSWVTDSLEVGQGAWGAPTSPLASLGAAPELLLDPSGCWGLGKGLLPCQTPAPPPVTPPGHGDRGRARGALLILNLWTRTLRSGHPQKDPRG